MLYIQKLKNKGVTAAQIADVTGVCLQTAYKYLNGQRKPRDEIKAELVNAGWCDYEDFFHKKHKKQKRVSELQVLPEGAGGG